MKIIKEPERTELKTVQYFNLSLQVPVKTNYITAIPDGNLIGWSGGKPTLEFFSFTNTDIWVGEVVDFRVGKVDLEGMDWKDTLKEV